MGLDNGIVIETKELIDDLPYDLDYTDYDRGRKELEVVYYRKCWGIRNTILNAFDDDGDQGYIDITFDDIDTIISIIQHFDNENVWNEDADSIWEYDEICKHLKQHVRNLKWLKKYIKQHPENVEKVYFYDSY